MKTIYFDTETTSLNPGQICQLSEIIVEDGVIKAAKNFFFSVEKMDAGAQKVHGFSLEQLIELSGYKTFKDNFNELATDFADATIIAHNLPFDEKFISSEFWRCGMSYRPAGRMDTMTYFRDLIKIPAKTTKYGLYKNPKLEEVINYLKLNPERLKTYCAQLFNSGDNYHDSRFDTTAMFVACNVAFEAKTLKGAWTEAFVNLS